MEETGPQILPQGQPCLIVNMHNIIHIYQFLYHRFTNKYQLWEE